MKVEFDPATDAANRIKHGVSLADAAGFKAEATIADKRVDYGESRFNAFGRIEGVAYCLTYTVRGERMRVISLRRAHAREYRRDVI